MRRAALLVRRRWFVQQLGRDDDEASLDLPSLLEQLADAPASPLLVEALIRLGFDLLPSRALAKQAHSRAVEVADSLGDPRNSFGQGRRWLAPVLGGPVAEAITLSLEMLPSVRARFPSVASELEADCAWWLCCLGRYDEAQELGIRAVNGIARPEMARRNWGVATAHLSAALMARGRWNQAASRLDQARSLDVTGTRGAVLDVLAGVLACYRGDLSSAREAAKAAQSRLPDHEDRVWPAIRGWVRWLHAEIGAARDDSDTYAARLRRFGRSRDWISPRTSCGDHYSSRHDSRPIWLVGPSEDGVVRDQPRRALWRNNTCTRCARSRLDSTEPGDLGLAWMAQFEAECGRFAGAVDPTPWTRAAELWGESVSCTTRVGRFCASASVTSPPPTGGRQQTCCDRPARSRRSWGRGLFVRPSLTSCAEPA